LSTATRTPEFDLDRPWRLDSRVALRTEAFGALAYHFGTRRLSFLKSRALLDVVQQLGECESGRAACAAAGVPEHELPTFQRALSRLASTGMICERSH
jgi:putative mycofactocin binding protein MftB